jgi:hypothetical protein
VNGLTAAPPEFHLADWLPVDASYFDAPAVHCPACDFEYMYPTRVEVDRGGEVVQVDAEGVGFAWRRRAARGVIITLEFACENGHRSRLGLRFHKGQTYVRSEVLGAIADDAWPPTIWRD